MRIIYIMLNQVFAALYRGVIFTHQSSPVGQVLQPQSNPLSTAGTIVQQSNVRTSPRRVAKPLRFPATLPIWLCCMPRIVHLARNTRSSHQRCFQRLHPVSRCQRLLRCQECVNHRSDRIPMSWISNWSPPFVLHGIIRTAPDTFAFAALTLRRRAG